MLPAASWISNRKYIRCGRLPVSCQAYRPLFSRPVAIGGPGAARSFAIGKRNGLCGQFAIVAGFPGDEQLVAVAADALLGLRDASHRPGQVDADPDARHVARQRRPSRHAGAVLNGHAKPVNALVGHGHQHRALALGILAKALP